MEKNIQDKDLGVITLRTTPRATRYTLKISKGKITATMPPGGDEKRMIAFIMENKARLVKALQKHPARPLLDERSELQATTFRLHIFRTERSNFYMRLEDGVLHIACPNETRFEEEEVQSLLKSMLEKALRHEAKRLLPERITLLARQHGFMLTGVKINNSKTHWGSCTMKKSINLSQSLMLLPWHLVDYVLLHELCHTIEMNHSERFWKLMDKVTDVSNSIMQDRYITVSVAAKDIAEARSFFNRVDAELTTHLAQLSSSCEKLSHVVETEHAPSLQLGNLLEIGSYLQNESPGCADIHRAGAIALV